jgi:hypothetical protein
MGMIEVKKDFTRRELLWFGPLFALFVGIIGTILYRRLGLPFAAYGLWTFSGVLIIVYYLLPAIQTPTYRAWIYAVMPIGWVVSHVVIFIAYYFVVTPIGLAMKVVGYDPMQRQFDRSAETYWVKREPTTDTQRYFRQY